MKICYATSFYDDIDKDGYPVIDEEDPVSFEVPDDVKMTYDDLAKNIITSDIDNICFNAPIIPRKGIPSDGHVTISLYSVYYDGNKSPVIRLDYQLSQKELDRIHKALGSDIKKTSSLKIPLVMEGPNVSIW